MEQRFRTKEYDPYQPMYRGASQGGVKHRTYEAQRTSSEDHSFWWTVVNKYGNHHARWGRFKDVGGPFLSQKFVIEMDSWEPTALYRDRGRYGIYDSLGMLYPDHEIRDLAWSYREGVTSDGTNAETRLATAAPSYLSDSSMDSYGATAISRVQPTNPVFEGATTVAELISERKFFALPGRAGGPSGEYLNYQLGIAPTISALGDLRTAAETSEKVLRQLERDSGKLIRRRYTWPEEVETTRVEQSREGIAPPFDVWNSILTSDAGAKLITVTRTTTKRWFSGAFTYYLPKGGWRRTLAELDRVYGIKPGIDTGWELVPFSFVADYFVNMGDVLSNMNAFASDGLVMPYGYMMTTQKVEKSYDLTWGLWINNVLTPTTIRGKVTYTTLQRRRANPFGFGVSDNDLSLRQMSILAALGMSRK